MDEFESSGGAFGKREEFSKLKQGGASTKKSTTMVPMPDHCYYSPQLRKLVEESDAEYRYMYMARYMDTYNWENFVEASRSTSGDDEDGEACARFRDSKIHRVDGYLKYPTS